MTLESVDYRSQLEHSSCGYNQLSSAFRRMGSFSFHPFVTDWFATALGTPTAAQERGWPAIARGDHTLIAAPTGSGKTLAAFLIAIDAAGAGEPRRSAARRSARALRVAAQGAEHRHPQEPRRAPAGHCRRGGRPRAARAAHHGGCPHRRHAGRGTRGDGEDAAAHPRHDARVALPAADVGAQPPDAGDRAHRHRGRDPRGDRQPPRRAPRAVARAAAARDGPPAAAHRPLGHAEADRGRGAVAGWCGGAEAPPTAARLHDRRRGARPADGSRHRAAALRARHRDGARGVGRVLRPARGAGAGASHDAGVRQHAQARRAPGAASQRAPRRGAGGDAPREPLEGVAPRRRDAPQGGPAARAGGHRVARARHRHRIGRSGVPDRLAAHDGRADPAGGPLGPPRGRPAERARVSRSRATTSSSAWRSCAR